MCAVAHHHCDCALHPLPPLPDNWPDDLRMERKEVRWADPPRRSGHTSNKMKAGGLIGVFDLVGDSLPEVLPLLHAGEFLHAGKLTSLGLGEYRLHFHHSMEPGVSGPTHTRG